MRAPRRIDGDGVGTVVGPPKRVSAADRDDDERTHDKIFEESFIIINVDFRASRHDCDLTTPIMKLAETLGVLGV